MTTNYVPPGLSVVTGQKTKRTSTQNRRSDSVECCVKNPHPKDIDFEQSLAWCSVLLDLSIYRCVRSWVTKTRPSWQWTRFCWQSQCWRSSSFVRSGSIGVDSDSRMTRETLCRTKRPRWDVVTTRRSDVKTDCPFHLDQTTRTRGWALTSLRWCMWPGALQRWRWKIHTSPQWKSGWNYRSEHYVLQVHWRTSAVTGAQKTCGRWRVERWVARGAEAGGSEGSSAFIKPWLPQTRSLV